MLCRFPRGCLNSFREINVSLLWVHLRQQSDFAAYFPDYCLKKVPSREYFWKVFALLRPAQYEELLGQKMQQLKETRKLKEDKILMSSEAQHIFRSFDFQTHLSLLRQLISQAACGLSEGAGSVTPLMEKNVAAANPASLLQPRRRRGRKLAVPLAETLIACLVRT